jgi:DNA-binding transcriptional ArsR family regulator
LIVLAPETFDERRVQTELSGNTLSVYWYILSKRRSSMGVREIQRALGFSSSSTAHYHLEKLRDLGLVDKNSLGDFNVTRIVKVGILQAFVFAGGHVFPKHLIYAVATSLMLFVFASLYVNSLTPLLIAALSPGVLATIIFWVEAIMVWRRIRSISVIGSRD